MTQRENRELMKINLILSRPLCSQTSEQSEKVVFAQHLCLFVIIVFAGCFSFHLLQIQVGCQNNGCRQCEIASSQLHNTTNSTGD